MRFSRAKSTIVLLAVFLLLSGFKLEDEEGDKGDVEAVAKAQQLFGPRSGGVLRLTVDQCVERALTYHPEMEVADYSIQTAEEKKKEASKIGWPIFDYEYQVGPVPKDVGRAVESFFSGDISVLNKFKLGIGVPIQTFGKVKVGKQLADTGIVSEKEKKVQKKSDIALKVKQLYYGILLGGEIHHLLKSARNGVSKEIDKREAAGGTDPTELLKLRLFRAELEKKIEDGDKKVILAREALRVQVGMDPAVRLELASGKLRPIPAQLANFESYKNRALEQRSDLKLLD